MYVHVGNDLPLSFTVSANLNGLNNADETVSD